MFAYEAVNKVLSLKNVNNILDVGSGKGEHASLFSKAGKQVFCVDIEDSKTEVYDDPNVFFICSDFMKLNMSTQVDCVWVSHVLEHQLNVNNFLKSCLSMLKPGGYIAITVPPYKPEIVGGHLSIWNAGLVLYNLILAGTSCRGAMVKQYGYNISVIVPYMPITLPQLNYDNGDIETLSRFFPKNHSKQGFNGNILRLNW